MKSNWMAWGLALLWALALPVAAQVALPDDLPPVPADKAQVVFLKPGGGLWAGLNVGIVSLEGDQRRLHCGAIGIGVSQTNNHIQCHQLADLFRCDILRRHSDELNPKVAATIQCQFIRR